MRDWLKDKRAGRPQEAIAEAAKITQQMYSLIEAGDRRPSVDAAKRIAAVIGFDWTMFFQDENPADKEAM